MSEHASLAVTYTPKSKVDLQENHWIRVEQIKTDAETISVGEAAGIIDDIFGIDACDDGLSGGGVSIHAPVKGRLQRQTTNTPSTCFNPRPREGATERSWRLPLVSLCFNPRPGEGATFTNK